jgi:hypothetical protein
MSTISDSIRFIAAGVSDIDGRLLKEALEKFESVVEKVYPTGSFYIKFKTDNEKISIYVVLGENLESEVKHTDKNKYRIQIDSDQPVSRVYATLAHEVTHISQKYNGFKAYEFEKIYKDVKERGVKYRHFYDEMHAEFGTEKEANLVGLLTLLKRNNIEDAVDLAMERHEYFTLPNQTYLKKAISMGVNRDALNKFKNMVDAKFNDSLSYYKEKGTDLSYVLIEAYGPLLTMLGIVDKYTDKIKELWEASPKKDDSCNYPVLKRNLNKFWRF